MSDPRAPLPDPPQHPLLLTLTEKARQIYDQYREAMGSEHTAHIPPWPEADGADAIACLEAAILVNRAGAFMAQTARDSIARSRGARA